MSLLVSETSQIIDRLSIVASTDADLRKINESIGFELTTLVGQNQNLNLNMASLPAGALRSWTSFTLGQRGQMPVRISLMGLSLEQGQVDISLVSEISEAFFYYLPRESPLSDEALKLKIPSSLREKPCVFLDFFADQDSLRGQALVEWSQRHFKRSLYLPFENGFFAKSLEWVLSF